MEVTTRGGTVLKGHRLERLRNSALRTKEPSRNLPANYSHKLPDVSHLLISESVNSSSQKAKPLMPMHEETQKRGKRRSNMIIAEWKPEVTKDKSQGTSL